MKLCLLKDSIDTNAHYSERILQKISNVNQFYLSKVQNVLDLINVKSSDSHEDQSRPTPAQSN